MISGMNESEVSVGGLSFSTLETSGLVEALAGALAEHWPAANDVDELARTFDRRHVTLMRRGLNAAGVTIISTASVTLQRSGERSLYVLRDRARKGFWIDDVIIDILPGWDQEATAIERIRTRALELAPEGISELGPIEHLRSMAPQTLWGTVRRRDGVAEAGATWKITEYDEELDLLRGSFTTPKTRASKMLSAKASTVSAWPLGRVATAATALRE